jgi:hypothetical protein
MCSQLHNKMQLQLIYHFRVMKARRIRKCRTRVWADQNVYRCACTKCVVTREDTRTSVLANEQSLSNVIPVTRQFKICVRCLGHAYLPRWCAVKTQDLHRLVQFRQTPTTLPSACMYFLYSANMYTRIRQRSTPSGHKNSNLEILKYHARELLRCDAALYRT